MFRSHTTILALIWTWDCLSYNDVSFSHALFSLNQPTIKFRIKFQIIQMRVQSFASTSKPLNEIFKKKRKEINRFHNFFYRSTLIGHHEKLLLAINLTMLMNVRYEKASFQI